jgi:hypothetical protein
MKNLFYILTASTLLFASCDYVDVPQQAGGSIIIPTSDTIRRVFIEDFTGHTCPNCPSAARMIEDSLKPNYPGQIVSMGVHLGYYAIPGTPTGANSGTFLEDFRVTGEDLEYDNIFSATSFPFPSYLVNRHGFPSAYPTPVPDSPALVDSLLHLPMTAYLKITPNYNASTRVLTVNVAGEFMVDTTGSYNIALFLTEDSIVAAQTDNTIAGGFVYNYVFNNLFRGCINSPGSILGAQAATGTITANTGINYSTASLATFTVNASYNAAHCHIIAILYKTTDYGVLQAAETELIP